MGIPNKPGNWEWYDNRQLRHIVDIVMDNGSAKIIHKGERINIENWPNRWGDRIGDRGTISDSLLFDGEPK